MHGYGKDGRNVTQQVSWQEATIKKLLKRNQLGSIFEASDNVTMPHALVQLKG